MGKKILIVITIVLITGLLTGWYFFTREAKYFGTSAFRAVPENVSVIVRIHDLGDYTTQTLNNPLWKTYSGFPGVSALYQQLHFADSLLMTYPEVKNSLINKDLTVMFDAGNENSGNLCVLELASLTEKRALSALVDDFFSRKGAVIEKLKAGRTELSSYSWNENGLPREYIITFYRGLFLGANDRQMIMQAVSRLASGPNQGDSILEKANKTATDNVNLNIYLNHSRLPEFSHPVFSETFWKRLERTSPLAAWSEIDLIQKNNELLVNGFSFTSDSLNHYLGIFLHQQPGSFTLADLFPAETSFFMGFVINNGSRFFEDYENLLARNNQKDNYRNALKETDSLYHIDIQKAVTDHIDGAAAMVFTLPDPLLPDENKFLVLRLRSGSAMEQALIPITVVPVKGKPGLTENPGLYRIDKETVFKIYKTPVNDFGKRVFGQVFSDVTTNYFTFYDNCLIMGNSYESLGRFLRSNVLQETMGNNESYREFISGFSGRMNFLLWSSPGRSLPFFKEMLNPGIYQHIERQLKDFRKIGSLAWQIGTENGIVYNMAGLKFNPEEVQERQELVAWKSHLGNRVINQPQFVINPADKGHREIVLQDSEYNFVRMSNAGRVIWKIKLPGPIRSKVFQLDYFRNGQTQYFFNTDQALHLIDHEGNYLQNYPLTLRSEATNGVSVFDYDNNRDYRFFIAGKDHKVYLYDKKGKIITDWTPPKTEHDVTKPVQYFRVEKKDYIVFSDKSRGYILDRKGKNSVSIKGDIAWSRNPFTYVPRSGNIPAKLVTTDLKGNIITIGFDGSVKRLSVGAFSDEHFFIHEDIDSDKRPDYVFLDGDWLVAYNQKATAIFSRKLNHGIGLPPEVITFHDRSKKIGIADSTENLIYLINGDGSIYKGFPLEGNSGFTFGFSDNGVFSLIAGTSDGYVNNYQIK